MDMEYVTNKPEFDGWIAHNSERTRRYLERQKEEQQERERQERERENARAREELEAELSRKAQEKAREPDQERRALEEELLRRQSSKEQSAVPRRARSYGNGRGLDDRLAAVAQKQRQKTAVSAPALAKRRTKVA